MFEEYGAFNDAVQNYNTVSYKNNIKILFISSYCRIDGRSEGPDAQFDMGLSI